MHMGILLRAKTQTSARTIDRHAGKRPEMCEEIVGRTDLILGKRGVGGQGARRAGCEAAGRRRGAPRSHGGGGGAGGAAGGGRGPLRRQHARHAEPDHHVPHRLQVLRQLQSEMQVRHEKLSWPEPSEPAGAGFWRRISARQ